MFDGDFYDFLGVPHDATQEDIKHAYRKLALKYHPDRGSEKDDRAMKTLNYIYSILSDPAQRASYDDSIAYTQQKRGRESAYQKAKTREEPPIVEDYSKAVFVNAIQATDSAGKTAYIRLEDYIYYPVSVKKKILFYGYQGQDYYRVKVEKIYSKKRNSFHKIPLFVVRFDSMEQIVFEKDFSNYWLSEAGYAYKEKSKAIRTFVIGLIILGIILYKLLNLE